VDEGALLDELAPTAGRLLERHLAAARDWLPHELVPWATAVAGRTSTLPPGAEAALILNILTEDGLPYYTTGLYLRFGGAPPWWDWIRRWTAEEMRHGTALHDYVCVTGAVDATDLERRRLQHVSTASVPTAPSVLDACVYLALQELATRVAHANTARLLPDGAGRRLVARIAADEDLHHRFYRDLVGAALELVPGPTVEAIDRQVRHFAMPGHDIAGFAGLAAAVADAGIYSAALYLDHVVRPLVETAWRADAITLTDVAAGQAQARLLRFVERLATIAPRIALTTEVPAADAARGGSS
jgi:acyl-[acyl-carrier-protein] desaturase